MDNHHKNSDMLQHVAIIMDGNGRWARERNLPRREGHRKGVENVRKIVRKTGALGIKYLTLYAFSADNWKRPQSEVSDLMSLLETFLIKQAELLHEHNIRLHTIGRIEELNQNVFRILSRIQQETSIYQDYHLILALNYGSRNEVLDAVGRYVKAVRTGMESLSQLSWPTFRKYLSTGYIPDPELVIRTSGEHRISNFLLLQSAYAEYYFSPVYWPDFGPDCLEAAIEDYYKRERRFGMTGDQIRQERTAPLNSTL